MDFDSGKAREGGRGGGNGPGTSIEGEGVEGEEGGKWVGGGGLRCGFVLLTRRYGRLVDCGPLPTMREGKEGCVQGVSVLSGQKERWSASYQAGSSGGNMAQRRVLDD